MKTRRILKILILTLCLCISTGTILFLYNANNNYNINNGFTPLPLKFNPDNSSSSYSWHGVEITVYNGFIKGIQKGEQGNDSLIIRALSPLPSVELKAANEPVKNIAIAIENINPEFYAKNIEKNLGPVRTTVNTLKFTMNLNTGEKKRIIPSQQIKIESTNYVILGDNRDGYETFAKIIDQVNGFNPILVIDNGDLVFSGKPNQYRLFDRTVSKVSTTLCTTLGNHDIRRNGRAIYKKLYGPEYYSFDLGNIHFIFLDSSPGWSQKQAISNEQYAWLERDLKKSQGKHIYVITHVPPEDPRSGTAPNKIPAYMDKVKQGDSFFEQKLDKYSENESLNHGFQDKKEAELFENLMTKYKVDTVYLSHIHSYFDFNKNGVRYIISGGAGAELLTKNSYYHYLIAKNDTKDTITMVQLPSPPNLLLKRYQATVSLFAEAMYEENHSAVILYILSFIILLLIIVLLLSIKFKHGLNLLWMLAKDSIKYISVRYKEIFGSNKSNR